MKPFYDYAQHSKQYFETPPIAFSTTPYSLNRLFKMVIQY